jgi:8-oxo-dGTP diphosphatase
MRTRPGAYGWIVRDGHVLLTYWSGKYWSGKNLMTGEDHGAWTLPGGGMEYGEQCEDTIRREVAEETGYQVAVGPLLGVSNLFLPEAEVRDYGDDHHSIQVVHVAEIVGGDFLLDVGGTTIDARWFPLTERPPVQRVGLVNNANVFARAAGLGSFPD